jgi:replication initiation protein RepC
MAFIQATAPTGPRTDTGLSADKSVPSVIPERHIIVDMLRNAAKALSLSVSEITTLDAMLSCLPPKRGHHTVFASNATLTFRRNGLSDRTIRRHAARLQEAGLLVRRDSPNGKRFTRYNAREGKALRFGFDLSPLFARLHEIAHLAAEALQVKEQLLYLKCKLRAAANQLLETDPEHSEALAVRQALRRKLSLSDCENLLKCLAEIDVSAECDDSQSEVCAADMSASDGQNVRHHHRSNLEHTDKKEAGPVGRGAKGEDQRAITVPELRRACPEAMEFSLRTIETVQDVITHARTLAPMLGIDSHSYQAAQDRLGALGTAVTVWAMMQFHDKIERSGAYFRAITTGAKSADFDPVRLIRRLGATVRA